MKKISRRRKFFSSAALVGVLLVTLLGGCGNGAGDAQKGESASGETAAQAPAETGKDIVLNIPDNGNTGYYGLDPANANGSRLSQYNVMENLFILDNETSELEPYLVDTYDHPDDLTWVLNIKDGIEFSNGEPLTGEAVKLALDYVAENNTKINQQLNVNTITAEGQKVTIVTNDTVATLPNILTSVDIFYYDENALDFDNDGIIGTGAYVLESWDLEGNKTLVRNENYWQGMPTASQIKVVPIMDKASLTLALQSKEIDMGSDVTAADMTLFENNSEYNVVEFDKGRMYFLYLNPGYTGTQDPAVREALQYAFDRQSFIDGVYDGRGRAVSSIFPDWTEYYDSSVQQNGNCDTEKASKILADAGYADTNGDGFLEKDGETLKLNITTYNSNGFPVLAQAIQGSMRTIGIDSEIVIADQIDTTLNEGQFNIALFGHNTLTYGDSYNILSAIFASDGYENYIKYNNETLDSLVKELQTTTDVDERARLTIEIQKEIYASNNYVFLVHVMTYNVFQSDVQNIGTFRNNRCDLWKVTK